MFDEKNGWIFYSRKKSNELICEVIFFPTKSVRYDLEKTFFTFRYLTKIKNCEKVCIDPLNDCGRVPPPSSGNLQWLYIYLIFFLGVRKSWHHGPSLVSRMLLRVWWHQSWNGKQILFQNFMIWKNNFHFTMLRKN